MSRFSAKKMIVIDLGSGRYLKDKIGHERFNLIKDPADGKFYGYIPPKDGANIIKFGAGKQDLSIDEILVVYVRKKEGSKNREIVAFCPNAIVYRHGQTDMAQTRTFEDRDKKIKSATYSVKSDNLYNLEDHLNKFIINVEGKTDNKFRAQRFYGETYPELDKKIMDYIEDFLENKDLLDDNTEEQEEIQRAKPATSNDIRDSAYENLKVVSGKQGKTISKNNRLSKAAIIDSNYKCQIDPSHITFRTKYKELYMEGHHIIPCTVTNSEIFWNKDKRNIDCYENIICICPNCHRAIHFGDDQIKTEKVKIMYAKQAKKLAKVGIHITEEELLAFYKNKNVSKNVHLK